MNKWIKHKWVNEYKNQRKNKEQLWNYWKMNKQEVNEPICHTSVDFCTSYQVTFSQSRHPQITGQGLLPLTKTNDEGNPMSTNCGSSTILTDMKGDHIHADFTAFLGSFRWLLGWFNSYIVEPQGPFLIFLDTGNNMHWMIRKICRRRMLSGKEKVQSLSSQKMRFHFETTVSKTEAMKRNSMLRTGRPLSPITFFRLL